MSYKFYKLPEYPVTRDMWDELKSERRPIVIYGMGNGADKLISEFSEKGIEYTDIFASDGFVRGHSFHGIRVKSFSEIKELYPEFVIALSFASNRTDVIEMLSKINSEYCMYVPDMPVAGEEYFDKDFFNANYESIKLAYDSLADDESRSAFAAVINYKLSGKMEYLMNCYSATSEIYSLLGDGIRVAVDAGAYNGDTAREMLGNFDGIERIYAFEPDKRTYKRLEKFIESNNLESVVIPTRAALWSADSNGAFIGSGNRNSSVSSTASYKSREEEVTLIALDSVISERVDYIKYDVEGAEYEALLGSERIINEYHPRLLVSLYHRSEDIFSLINHIHEKHPEYKLYIRRSLCLPAWEAALIAK